VSNYKVDYQDLPAQVYETLKEMILTGELRSGEKLVQDDLAQTLGVSRTPLLSALSKLENEMLVKSLPRRGFVVRTLTAEEFVHIYDLRLRLEPLGAAEAATSASDAEIAELRRLVAHFAEMAVAGDEGQIKESDYRLHMQIMAMSRNQLLYNIISSFNIILVANLEGLLKEAGRSAAQHSTILRAIEARDSRRAEETMHFHIEESRERVLERTRDNAAD
jgi:DNA-binding GntR family transcriptional regulator